MKIPNNQEHASTLYTPLKFGEKEAICGNCNEEKCKGYCKIYAERNELLGIKPNKMQLEFAQRYVYGRSYKKETWGEYKKRNNLEVQNERI